MNTKGFGQTEDGRKAALYFLENKNGMQAHVSDYGATLVSLLVPDRNKKLRDIVLGYDDVLMYEKGMKTMGAVVGRYANRTGGASFRFAEKEYRLTANNGANSLHGGRDFYSKRLWTPGSMSETAGGDGETLTLELDSPDMDQGFPGSIHIKVSYTLSDNNELTIDYNVRSTDGQDAPVNLTNHSYFNLSGHDSGSVLGHKVCIHADCFTEIDEQSIPTGRLPDVTGTPMDFRKEKPVGEDINRDYAQLRMAGGYDHNYVLSDKQGELKEAAYMYSEESGIKMHVVTDLPGLQFYTANYLKDERGKDGAVYGPQSAACFETQFWPDSLNKVVFQTGVVKAGSTFSSRTIYAFETI